MKKVLWEDRPLRGLLLHLCQTSACWNTRCCCCQQLARAHWRSRGSNAAWAGLSIPSDYAIPWPLFLKRQSVIPHPRNSSIWPSGEHSCFMEERRKTTTDRRFSWTGPLYIISLFAAIRKDDQLCCNIWIRSQCQNSVVRHCWRTPDTATRVPFI